MNFIKILDKLEIVSDIYELRKPLLGIYFNTKKKKKKKKKKL